MSSPEGGRRPLRAFDGHNDTLLSLHEKGAPDTAFLSGAPDCHLDLPRALEGGFGGGLFAMFTQPQEGPLTRDDVVVGADGSWSVRDLPALSHELAAENTAALLDRAERLERAGDGAIEIVRDVDALDRCWDAERLALVLHLEGAEAIDPELEAVEALYAAGVRSLGLVWSRPNAYGHGVPFRFPASPDTGPGLTDAGRRLVRRCNQLGIVVDVSHLNEAGFWDVARTAAAPFVASHSAAHALCESSRNLRDEQLRQLAAADGLVGVIFDTGMVRADGRIDPDTPISAVADHFRYVADLIGVDHVAFGSDFDGATMPAPLRDAGGLPRLIDALRDAGFTPDELDRVCWGNWRRVLGDVWRPVRASGPE